MWFQKQFSVSVLRFDDACWKTTFIALACTNRAAAILKRCPLRTRSNLKLLQKGLLKQNGKVFHCLRTMRILPVSAQCSG